MEKVFAFMSFFYVHVRSACGSQSLKFYVYSGQEDECGSSTRRLNPDTLCKEWFSNLWWTHTMFAARSDKF